MWEMEFAFMRYEDAEWKYTPLARTLLGAGWEPFAMTHGNVGFPPITACTIWFRREVENGTETK